MNHVFQQQTRLSPLQREILSLTAGHVRYRQGKLCFVCLFPEAWHDTDEAFMALTDAMQGLLDLGLIQSRNWIMLGWHLTGH